MKKTRYRLIYEDIVIGESTSIDGIANMVGCTRGHIYQRIVNGEFTYKKRTYKIIDKLDLI